VKIRFLQLNNSAGWDTQNGTPNFVLFCLTEHYKFVEKKMSKSGIRLEMRLFKERLITVSTQQLGRHRLLSVLDLGEERQP
jgi:hypothetical protein